MTLEKEYQEKIKELEEELRLKNITIQKLSEKIIELETKQEINTTVSFKKHIQLK